ncbi:MAG TPA: glycosyltransferase family 39 protein, partial [Syntrophorhabdaceae bacterium]|nr:glycosyltransferase family 39 protein [Syntrophorhabdaceae bacterium]
SGKMVSIIFGSFTVVPLYLLIKRLFDDNVAFVASLLFAVHPRFVEYSSDVLREPLFWFLCISALWLAWEGIVRARWFLIALSSFSCGLAIFTRLEGVLVFCIIILWIIWSLAVKRKDRARGLLYGCIFILAVPILASPGLIILESRLHKWEAGISINKIQQLLSDTGAGKDASNEFSDHAPQRLQQFLELSRRHQYTTFFAETVYKFSKSINVLVLLLVLFGVLRRRTIPYSEKDVVILIWFAVAFVGSYIYVARTYYLGTRHGLVMGLASLAWAGAGFFEIRDRLRALLSRKTVFSFYLKFDTVILMVMTLLVLIPQTAFSYRYDKIELKRAGIELKTNGFSTSNFLVPPTLARVAFYAGANVIELPVGSGYKMLKELFAQHHDSVLLIDERSIDDYIPELRKVIAEGGLEKITIPAFHSYHKYSFTLYRIL